MTGITAISFEEKDGLLVTASKDGTARVWDCSAALYTARETDPKAERVGRFDGRTVRYDAHASGPSVRQPPPAWPPQDPWKQLIPDGEWRIEWNNGRLRVFNKHDTKPILSLSDTAKLIAFDPVHNRLATIGLSKDTDMIRLWDISTAHKPEPVQFHHNGKVLALAFSPDARILA